MFDLYQTPILPVVGDNGQIIGILHLEDLALPAARQLVQAEASGLQWNSLLAPFIRPIVSVSPETSVEHAAETVLQCGHRILVMEKEILVGTLGITELAICSMDRHRPEFCESSDAS
jgi:CBS-domain-containing membrane protein